MLVIREQHKRSGNSASYQDASKRAEILVCSPDLSIGDFLETDTGFVLGGRGGGTCVQLLLFPQRYFRDFRDPDPPP